MVCFNWTTERINSVPVCGVREATTIMPLTAELQARLMKRGIIKENEPSKPVVVPECPNRGNPHHECSAYCARRWGGVKEKPKQSVILPPNWKKVVDEKTSCPYFWNTKTNEVSWFPPPGSVSNTTSTNNETKKKEDLVETMKTKERPRHTPYSKPKRKERYKPRKKDELDPMDPAAYSDAPMGTWSTGLDKRDEAKTGVDTTANGPLYQMRPYPSPGDVLRANKRIEEEKQ